MKVLFGRSDVGVAVFRVGVLMFAQLPSRMSPVSARPASLLLSFARLVTR